MGFLFDCTTMMKCIKVSKQAIALDFQLGAIICKEFRDIYKGLVCSDYRRHL